MSSGERPERIQTLPAQKTALREFFTKENAQTWLSKLRNKFFRTLILLPEFNNLTTLHISYQWRKFSAEYIVRRQVGAKYFIAALEMSDLSGDLMKEIITALDPPVHKIQEAIIDLPPKPKTLLKHNKKTSSVKHSTATKGLSKTRKKSHSV
jgi:hypothetical protein